jgi:predicted pyridoxine 5'-phosphate oxidase superfamily flavin-nucleotide-binding protein
LPKFERINDALREFIETQKVYFVGTAAPEGRVNVSAKGMDTLRVLGPNRIV